MNCACVMPSRLLKREPPVHHLLLLVAPEFGLFGEFPTYRFLGTVSGNSPLLNSLCGHCFGSHLSKQSATTNYREALAALVNPPLRVDARRNYEALVGADSRY